ncbi:triple QxxK/R motif-containing protein [Aplysia californica]|uniref:Triple QxxK/R motif-containing protein n=1 Tax=Aplysia californica TaxID=6500 RepID=A0ABM0K0E8_APLCA|nr:triple QxxK/R motif-containing protein [Aplysia californica]
MGKRDSSAQHCAPVDQYRKQIGKQDWKKSRKDVKLMKNRSEQDSQSTAQQIVLMLGVAIAVLSSLYVLLFWYLGAASLDEVKEERPV